MSPSVSIRTRETAAGDKRYHVRYRIGGRATPLRHAGAFTTKKAATARAAWVAELIASGRRPAEAIAELARPGPTLATLAGVWEEFARARVDVDQTTVDGYLSRLERMRPLIGQLEPGRVSEEDVRDLIRRLLEEGLSAGTLRQYVGTLRQVLDFAGVVPNPARARSVRLPRVEREVPMPPTASQVAAVLSAVSVRYRLPLRLAEQTGMRVGEVERLEWRDLDVDGSRLRVRFGKTPSARRWVTVPDWLMADLDALAPRGERSGEARVFPLFERKAAANAMRRACDAAGIPGFHPHDLRHRYASIMARRGVPRTDLAAQLGHKHVSHLDVYEHVILDE